MTLNSGDTLLNYFIPMFGEDISKEFGWVSYFIKYQYCKEKNCRFMTPITIDLR